MSRRKSSVLRPVETLSHDQRELTPIHVALMLLSRVRELCCCDVVAALWVHHDSIYYNLADVDPWDRKRDALGYTGPYPVICHPPCGPWGRYNAKCNQSKIHGVAAMHFVHKYGGVVEQPASSQLFATYGSCGLVTQVCQSTLGHLSEKKTKLYYALPGTVCSFNCPWCFGNRG